MTVPEPIVNYFKSQVELYFNVVERGWNVAIQAKEQNLYASMGMNHVTDIKKESTTKIYNIHNHQGKPSTRGKPSWKRNFKKILIV